MKSENLAILDKVKQDLAHFRVGNHAKNHRIPKEIQKNILKLYKLGWKAPKINKALNIATSSIYKWIKLFKKRFFFFESRGLSSGGISFWNQTKSACRIIERG